VLHESRVITARQIKEMWSANATVAYGLVSWLEFIARNLKDKTLASRFHQFPKFPYSSLFI
jgi:hypothetical protein